MGGKLCLSTKKQITDPEMNDQSSPDRALPQTFDRFTLRDKTQLLVAIHCLNKKLIDNFQCLQM